LFTLYSCFSIQINEIMQMIVSIEAIMPIVLLIEINVIAEFEMSIILEYLIKFRIVINPVSKISIGNITFIIFTVIPMLSLFVNRAKTLPNKIIGNGI